jgi:predicted lipoprotein with Yx(FWY)xxD motif
MLRRAGDRPVLGPRRGPRGRTAALALTVALVASACGSEETTDAAETPAPPTVIDVAESALGTYLVDGDGLTVYLFTEDSPGQSTCADACLQAWPPVLTSGTPVAAGGADQALLGTLVRPDGTVQVTYAGMPLYRFRSDMAAGDTRGQTVQGVWFVVALDGEAIGAQANSGETDEAAEEEDPSGGYGY